MRRQRIVEAAGALILVVATLSYACRGSLSSSSAGAASNQNAIGKPCTANSDCADDQFCDSPGWCDSRPGSCQLLAKVCSKLYDPVCGCGDRTANNECSLQYQEELGATFVPTSLAYGGNCRSVAITFCDSAHPCAAGMVCAVDRRGTCDGGDCAGFCATSEQSGDGPLGCNASVNCGENASICAAAACVDGDGGVCPYCLYTSGLQCDAGSDCPTNQLCTPSIHCSGSDACPSYCVVP